MNARDAPLDARYVQVVVDVTPAHLDRPFDYLVPPGVELGVGQRVRVPFAARRRAGWVVGAGAPPGSDPARILEVAAVDGDVRWFDAGDLRLYRWVAERYGGTLADVLRHALPRRVAAVESQAAAWAASEARADQEPEPPDPRPDRGPEPPDPRPDRGPEPPDPRPDRGPEPPRPAGAPGDHVSCADRRWLPYRASALLEALGRGPRRDSAPLGEAFSWRPLADEDHERLLLDLVARCLGTGRSALVLAPDPASRLLPAVLELAGRVGADLRGSRSDRDRYRDFLRCRMGHARVAVGERGAVFAPLRDLGLVVVDDEANPAYKERRSPRHHAREVALARARMAAAACVLVADLPSAPGWRLVQHGHVRTLAADRRSERDHAPRVDVVDLSDPRPGARRARLSERAAGVLTAAVRAGRTAVVLAARGGQGAALACRGCGRRRSCPLCAASVRPTRGVSTSSRGAEATRHTPGEQWECPACGWTGESSACPDCGDLRTSPLAAGAGRLAQELARSYPGAEVVRMEGFDAPGPTHRPAIAVMTRGSVIARPQWLGDEPVAAVVLPDADAMLRRPTLDASEDALRLWMGIARWTLPRRREAPRPAPGRVVVQTREPAHAAVQALVRWDAEGFWREEAERRAELRYPPSTSLLRIRAPFDRAEAAARAVREAVPAGDEVVGPDLDGATLVKSVDLRGTLAALTTLRHAWARADRKVRVDVDPVPAG